MAIAEDVTKQTAWRTYFVLSTQYLVLGAAVSAVAAGCTRHGSSSQELSLASQIAAVKAGQSDQIQVEHAPLCDDDLAALAGLEKLSALLLDHPQSQFSASGLEALAELPALTHLRIRGHGIDDDALAQIARLKPLQILNVPNATFTNAALVHLKQLPDLVQLRFGSPNVTDAGMTAIAELPALKRLHLIDVPIANAGLQELAQIRQLESLYIDGGNFSDEAITELFRMRPDLHVHLNQHHHDRDPHKHEH